MCEFFWPISSCHILLRCLQHIYSCAPHFHCILESKQSWPFGASCVPAEFFRHTFGLGPLTGDDPLCTGIWFSIFFTVGLGKGGFAMMVGALLALSTMHGTSMYNSWVSFLRLYSTALRPISSRLHTYFEVHITQILPVVIVGLHSLCRTLCRHWIGINVPAKASYFAASPPVSIHYLSSRQYWRSR
jgi:hypothetical protein